MNRRDFLFLRGTPKGRTLELSCHDLYIRTLSAPATPARDAVYNHEPWMGEPPAEFGKGDADDWLQQIEKELANVSVLRLLDDEWLASTDIRDQLQQILDAFENRGGRIEFGKTD